MEKKHLLNTAGAVIIGILIYQRIKKEIGNKKPEDTLNK